MLGVFKNGVVNPPQELHSPVSSKQASSKSPDEILKDFSASNPNNGFSLGFSDKGFLAYAPSQRQLNSHQRLFSSMNDVHCIFVGSLNNLNALNKQYGISKGGNEAMFVIEAYCTLRDRGPIPAHRVLEDFDGSFGFLLYDHKAGIVFAANGGDKAVNLYWGIAADGSVIISDNVDFIKPTCAKSFAPFPHGCMYHSERGLSSFEHPMKKMKAMPRVDSEGALCGAYFAVDVFSKVNNTMPRVGSEANWATWG